MLARDPIARAEKVIKTNEISTLLPRGFKTNGISTFPRLAGWAGYTGWLPDCAGRLPGWLARLAGWLMGWLAAWLAAVLADGIEVLAIGSGTFRRRERHAHEVA